MEPLKEGLGKQAIARLATNIERAWLDFDTAAFERDAGRGLARLELKERVAHVASVLCRYLPEEYAEALDIVVRAASEWDAGDADDPLRGFAAWPLFDFIEQAGAGDFRRSMAALQAITHTFTGEFAIRTFVASHPRRAFEELKRWTTHASEHVRRLASEGIRPRLPWAKRIDALMEDPEPIISVLERLKDDPALYVRRSVANNLNDIAKDHPDRVIDLCEQWLEGASPQRRWIVERATRTLVKQGHPRVWGLLGFTNHPKVEVSLSLSKKKIAIGQTLTIDVTVRSRARRRQRVVVDYAVHFVKANGKRSRKVFKLDVAELVPNGRFEKSRRHAFRQLSTRKHYPGKHVIEVLVNGQVEATADLTVTK